MAPRLPALSPWWRFPCHFFAIGQSSTLSSWPTTPTLSLLLPLAISPSLQDVVGPNCVMDYNFVASFITGFLITVAGLLVYLLRYLLFRLWEHQAAVKAVVTCAGPQAEAERTSREREDRLDFMASLLQGVFSWLDICYLGILLRVLPVFQSQQVGNTTVLAFAPSIQWWSSTHLALFIPSVIVMVLYIGGLPLFYAWVLFSARYHKMLNTEKFEKTFGFLTEGFTRKYYWSVLL